MSFEWEKIPTLIENNSLFFFWRLVNKGKAIRAQLDLQKAFDNTFYVILIT